MRVAQKVLQHFLHFSQNQQEKSEISSVVKFECPSSYPTCMFRELYNRLLPIKKLCCKTFWATFILAEVGFMRQHVTQITDCTQKSVKW
jgi:hypothetical protein